LDGLQNVGRTATGRGIGQEGKKLFAAGSNARCAYYGKTAAVNGGCKQYYLVFVQMLHRGTTDY